MKFTHVVSGAKIDQIFLKSVAFEKFKGDTVANKTEIMKLWLYQTVYEVSTLTKDEQTSLAPFMAHMNARLSAYSPKI